MRMNHSNDVKLITHTLCTSCIYKMQEFAIMISFSKHHPMYIHHNTMKMNRSVRQADC